MVSIDHELRAPGPSPVPQVTFSVLFDDADDCLVVVGELETETAPVFAGVIAGQIAHHRVDVRLDLSRMTFVDLPGFDALVAADRSLHLCGGGLRIVRAGALVRAVADVLGYQDLFEQTSPGTSPEHGGRPSGPAVEGAPHVGPAPRPPSDAG